MLVIWNLVLCLHYILASCCHTFLAFMGLFILFFYNLRKSTYLEEKQVHFSNDSVVMLIFPCPKFLVQTHIFLFVETETSKHFAHMEDAHWFPPYVTTLAKNEWALVYFQAQYPQCLPPQLTLWPLMDDHFIDLCVD